MLEKDYPITDLKSSKAQFIDMGDRCTRCPICGKVFYIRNVDIYIYKLRNKKGFQRIFCSYNCKRTAENKIEENFIDGRRRYISYPEDYPKNWIEVYGKYLNSEITRRKASALLDITVSNFDTLRNFYESLPEDEK